MENIKKTKKFIFTSPFQKEGQLQTVVYQADEDGPLQYGETNFPIIPVINGYVKENDEIEVVCIVTKCSPDIPTDAPASEIYPNAKQNYERFKESISELAKIKKFNYNLNEIEVDYDERVTNHLKIYSELISNVGDNEKIYADITFGSKAIPIVEIMALNYAYKLRKNTHIGAIVYGQYDPVTKKSYIYDVSPLFFMDAISNTMAQMKIENPAEKIKALLEID